MVTNGYTVHVYLYQISSYYKLLLMVKTSQRAITFKKTTVSELEAVYARDKKRPLNQSFSAYVENLLLQHLDYSKKLRVYGTFLDYINAIDNEIFLNDNRENKAVTIWIDGENRKLICRVDHSDCCVHVGFCYGVKEIYDVLIERGFRPPKKIT